MIAVTDATENPASDDSGAEIDAPRVAALGVHPVKSLRGFEPDVWRFDDRGPRLDRRWMLVDADDRFVSLREEPRLARCHVGLLDPTAPLPGLLLSWTVTSARSDRRTTRTTHRRPPRSGARPVSSWMRATRSPNGWRTRAWTTFVARLTIPRPKARSSVGIKP